MARRRISKTIRFLALAALLAAAMALPATAGGGPGSAGFADGLRAYDAGDYAATVAAWRPLAAAGDAEAQAALADLHARGLGVRRDPAEAARWYARAARQGHVVAQLNLGEMFATGNGVARDAVSAYVWLARAAAQGSDWAAARRDEIAGSLSATAMATARRRIAEPAGER